MKETTKITLQNRFTPFTTWRESRAQDGLIAPEENLLPYAMDKVKTLNKKMARASNNIQLKGELTVKGNANDPQFVGHYSSASYEYLRASFHAHIENCGNGVDICNNKDEFGLVVHTKITMYNEDKTDIYYTINFYHTTNTILVNRTGAKKSNIDMFMKFYQDIMSDIPQQQTNELNDFIKSACQEAIQELRGGSVNVDHCRSHCSTNTVSLQEFRGSSVSNSNHANQSISQQDAIPGSHTSPRLTSTGDVDHFEIREQSPNIDTIVKAACKDAIMELDGHRSLKRNACKRSALVDYPENDVCIENSCSKKQCHDTAGCSHWSLDMEVDSHGIPRSTSNQSTSSNLLRSDASKQETISQRSPTSMSKIEAIQHQLLSALDRINNLERKVLDITKENSDLKKELAEMKRLPSSQIPRIPSTGVAGARTFSDLARELGDTSSVHTMKKPKRTIPFLPNKNIVVSVEKDGDIIKNDDDIRRAIGGLDSDITIERISRSSSNCFKKFCVQLSEERMVDTTIDKWSPNLFGKSTVRKPIKQSTGKSVGVIKGVPLFIKESDLIHEQGGFGKTTISRITKARKPTRSVKVNFSSPELLQKAIADRVRSSNLTFVVEEYNQTSIVRCYKCHQYKHVASSCPNDKACFNCGGAYHGEECTETPHCVNCKGQHRPSSPYCPIYIKLYNAIQTRVTSSIPAEVTGNAL